jgi:hypothetical protein
LRALSPGPSEGHANVAIIPPSRYSSPEANLFRDGSGCTVALIDAAVTDVEKFRVLSFFLRFGIFRFVDFFGKLQPD